MDINYLVLIFIIAMMILEIPVINLLLDNFPLSSRILITITIEALFITLLSFLFWLWEIFSKTLGLGIAIITGAIAIITFLISLLILKKKHQLNN
ncbi:MAG: hypothetical protein ACQERB_03030 [Promethearchaeati archaeon]